MQLQEVLFKQGFGTRHECQGLIAHKHVRVNGTLLSDPWEEVDPAGLVFSVDDISWPYMEKAVIALHKPAGYECSRKPLHHPSVLSLLPFPLRNRGVQPVGRLDEDTTGLLILTDDGGLLHRLTHPKKHVSKVYRVTAKHPVTQSMISRLQNGVILDGEKEQVSAQKITMVSDRVFLMELTQGKYHQVKRMVAAVGNRVEFLHREKFGNYQMPKDLAPMQWCFITKEDLIGHV